MSENKYTRFLFRIVIFLIWFGLIVLTVSTIFHLFFPFLIAFVLSALLEPAVRQLSAFHLPRWCASAFCITAFYLLSTSLLAFLLWRAAIETAELLNHLPALLSECSVVVKRLNTLFYRFSVALPPTLRTFLNHTLNDLISQGVSLPSQCYEWIGQAAAWSASVLPSACLSLFTTILATYFTSTHRPELLSFLSSQFPSRWKAAFCRTWRKFCAVLGGWIRSQGILVLITFGELLIGFFILQLNPALILAALISLVDALPILGTGTVLIPWAILAALCGRIQLSFGLLLLYGIVSLIRSLLEPKLLSVQIGLPPLASLAAMYAGFRSFGIAGMILAPLAVTCIKQLYDCKIINLWRD